MKQICLPAGGQPVEVLPTVAPQHREALEALERLHNEAAAELTGVVVLRLRGDSMSPTFESGDFALIDASDTDVEAGGVFAIVENGSVVITQVELVYDCGRSTDRIRCMPRNPAYQPFELSLGDEASIIGRVVQKVTRL